jgi:hypothetical protein
MRSNRGNIKALLLGIVTMLAFGIFGIFFVQKQQSRINLINKQLKQNDENYAKGEIIISFNNNTTYKQAKEFLAELGYDIDNSNDYWKSINFIPTDTTTLNTSDLFTIKVPEGQENETVLKIVNYKSPLIRSASTNNLLQILN